MLLIYPQLFIHFNYLIYTDRKMRVTINENDTIEIRDNNLENLKYISFASTTDRVLAEIFYNCNF